MLEHIPPTDSIGEIGETRAAQLQALDDATLEPGVYIEQIGSFTEAESVQENFTVVVDNSIPATTTNPAADIPLPLPDVARCASTSPIAAGPWETEAGISNPIPGPDGNIPGDSEFAGPQEARALGEEPTLVEKTADEPGGPTIQEGVSGEIPRAEVPVNEGEARLEPGQKPEEAEPIASMRTQGEFDTAQPFITDEPLNAPDTRLDAETGEASREAPVVIGNVPGSGGRLYGHGSEFDQDTSSGGGSSSSGSGLPMGGGMGNKGENDDINITLGPIITTSGEGCGSAADKAIELSSMADSDPNAKGHTTISFTCVYASKDSSGKMTTHVYDITANSLTYDMKPSQKYKQGPDDSNPTPYTGGRLFPFDLKTPSDDDTPRMIPKITHDGKGDHGWRVDPDSPGDTGRFYGGIFGGTRIYPDSGGARPIDPVRDQADASSATLKRDSTATSESDSKE